MDHRRRRVSKVLFWVVIVSTVAGGAAILVMDRWIPGVMVMISGCVLGTVLGLLAYSDATSSLNASSLLRRNGVAFIILGILLSVIGVIMPDGVSSLMVRTGVFLVVSGSVVTAMSQPLRRRDPREHS